MSLMEPQIHRFTRDEDYAMADAGLFEGQRVELIEGEIVDMPPQNNPHYVAIGLLQEALRAVFPPTEYWVRTRGSVNLGGKSEPEPDIAVVRGTLRDFQDHPTTALLIAEVSDATLSFDRGRKARVYARAGIEDYWVLDLVHRTLEVRRNPRQAEGGVWTYDSPLVLSGNEVVTPLAMPQAVIRVADLLP